jgi:HPt (histidine-containing phosphotransfer) domain-containing protein
MAKSRTDTPSVTAFADHEVIVPPHRLGGALSAAAAGDAADIDPVARAEAALAQLSGEFAAWMQAECDRLDAARRRVAQHGPADSAKQDLFRAAHDIKGQAATFGFPLAADAAESLCRLIEHTPEFARVPPQLIDQHVDGVRAIIREDVRAGDHATAVALVRRLRQASEAFLVQENRHRPAYLQDIVAPPVAPRAGRD